MRNNNFLFPSPSEPLRRREEFFGSLSHLIKGPLAGAVGFVDYLFKGYAGKLAPRQQEKLAFAREALLKLNSSSALYLDIAAFDLGLIKPSGEKTDFSAVVRRVADEFRGAGTALRLNSCVCGLFADIEERWAEQLVYEICSCLRRLSPPKAGARLELSRRRNSARLEAACPCGLKTAGGIFSPFFSCDGKTGRGFAGRNGLGLSLALRIAGAHGGKISARVKKGELQIMTELPLSL